MAKLIECKRGLLSKISDDGVIKYARDWAKGIKFATSVFEGTSQDEFEKLFELAKMDRDGKTELYDGRTGEKMLEKSQCWLYVYVKASH